jgi:putative hydrolase of the HAD superfamily
MTTAHEIKCLFVDVGGVLLTNGWEGSSRELAAQTFGFDLAAFEERHRQLFDPFEQGHFTLDEYLDLSLFYEKRSFSKEQFKTFMFEQSQPYLDMIALIKHVKTQANLKVIVVNNESAELNTYRIHHFGLNHFVDAFVSSCSVGIRKPNPEILKLAVKIAQVPKEQILYIENTALYVDIASRLGIKSILHTGYESTHQQLESIGLMNASSPCDQNLSLSYR